MQPVLIEKRSIENMHPAPDSNYYQGRMPQSSRRPRILFVAEAVTLAHVARISVLARALDPSRYEVHGAWDTRYNDPLGPMPFPQHPIRSLATGEFLRRLSRGLPMHDTDTLRHYVRQDVELIERLSPDVIVGDFRLSLAASATIAGVPRVTIANAYWSPWGRQSFLFPEYDYPLARIVGERAARRLFRMFRGVGFAAHTRPLNRVLKEHRLPPIGNDIRTMYTSGDLTCYCDIPELVPIEGLPPSHQYIGPVLWSPAVPLPDWWDDLPDDRPIIYVTPGSSGELKWLPIVLDALADLPVTVLAATAGRINLQRIPDNARVAAFLPGTEAASRASLVICNGGSPTTSQALAGGATVLGIVSNNMDQHLNMQAVRNAGASEVLRARGVTAGAIRTAVASLLASTSHARAAQRLAEAHSRCRAEHRFPAMIDHVLGVS